MSGLDMFLETLDDLRKRSGIRAAEYDVIQAAGLLRRLLLDDLPLYVVAAREYKMKVQFSWYAGIVIRKNMQVRSHFSDPKFMQHMQYADGSSEPSAPPSFTLKQFLGDVVAAKYLSALNDEGWPPVNRDDWISVREVISHYANRRGGVHWDTRDPESPLLRQCVEDESLELLLRHALATIARTVIAGLEPLAARAFNDQQINLTRFRPPEMYSLETIADLD